VKRAIQSLHDVGLEEKTFNHYSNQISGGQKERVATARALISNPSIILADEPTGNLDRGTGKKVLKTFQKLNSNQKRTIVLITHEKYVAEHADRIIHILGGKINRDGKNHKKRIIYQKGDI